MLNKVHNSLISSQELLTLIFVDFVARSRLILDIIMSDPGAGPNNISSQRDPRTISMPNVFESFNPDESDSDNNFNIPHISDVPNVFESVNPDESDSDNNFNIPHISDESASSSDESVEISD